MLESLITSKTRIKLLLKFFSNANTQAYLRGLAEEFGESTNSIRVELNRLTEAGLLVHEQNGNTILYKANADNPFFKSLNKLVMKYLGVEEVFENVVRKIGHLDIAFITGDYAKGIDSGVIDLVLVANSLDHDYLKVLHARAEKITQRKIRMITLNSEDFFEFKKGLILEQSLILYVNPANKFEIKVNYQE